ncbi:hypothetical protein [Pseudogemmobacter sp. W21_MBD1_M6]|uniref:hypothetical protein n=1 Tax=Pseudogemmobacter sp. W21_MBD1_M6 TaxID=3240271 RepID=UPI003F95DAF8
MKQAIFGFLLPVVALFLVSARCGYAAAYLIGYGVLTLMAFWIALTFLWLWLQRATPLALGMVFGWAGAALIMGWWYVYALLGQPVWMSGNRLLFVPLAVYLGGAAIHSRVIWAAVVADNRGHWVPVGLATLVSGGLWLGLR